MKGFLNALGDDLSQYFKNTDLQSLADACYNFAKMLRAAKLEYLNTAGLKTSLARLILNASAPISSKDPCKKHTKLCRCSRCFFDKILLMPVKSPCIETGSRTCVFFRCSLVLLLPAEMTLQRSSGAAIPAMQKEVTQALDDLADNLSHLFSQRHLQILANAEYGSVSALRAAHLSDLKEAGLPVSAARLILSASKGRLTLGDDSIEGTDPKVFCDVMVAMSWQLGLGANTTHSQADAGRPQNPVKGDGKAKKRVGASH